MNMMMIIYSLYYFFLSLQFLLQNVIMHSALTWVDSDSETLELIVHHLFFFFLESSVRPPLPSACFPGRCCPTTSGSKSYGCRLPLILGFLLLNFSAFSFKFWKFLWFISIWWIWLTIYFVFNEIIARWITMNYTSNFAACTWN